MPIRVNSKKTYSWPSLSSSTSADAHNKAEKWNRKKSRNGKAFFLAAEPLFFFLCPEGKCDSRDHCHVTGSQTQTAYAGTRHIDNNPRRLRYTVDGPPRPRRPSFLQAIALRDVVEEREKKNKCAIRPALPLRLSTRLESTHPSASNYASNPQRTNYLV